MSEIVRHGFIPGFDCDPDEVEVSICIPTFDAAQERVKRCVQAIDEHTGHLVYEVVVLDCEKELRGYTIPMNEALSAAYGPVMVAMNDDVEVAEGWVDPLLKAIVDGAWCVTPDMTATDGPQVFHPYCAMYSRECWQEIGPLDEQFLWWASDIDYARRLMDAGHTPVKVVLDPPIRHATGSTATGQDQGRLNEWALQDLERFHRKWGTDAESEKIRMAVVTGANLDPRLAYLRPN